MTTTLTTRQVAENFGVSEWFVKEQVRKGRIGCLRVGTAWNAPMRFEPHHVEQLKTLMTPRQPTRKRRRRAPNSPVPSQSG